MRGVLLGFMLAVLLTVSVLSLRPGGIRRQLRLAARRLRIVLVLGGIFVVVSGAIRIAFPQGWVADFGPSLVAVVLAAVFWVIGRDPSDSIQESSRRPAGPQV
jgi:hypothetical protein